MSVAVAAGYRDIGASSMAYIPTRYSGKLLKKVYERLVLSDITNTDYEGEISAQGDKVIIRSVPSITINDYVKGQNLVFEQPTSASVQLDIDKAKSWSFVTDAIDDKQTDLKKYTDQWTTDAAKQLATTLDAQVLGSVYADAEATNKGANAGYKTGGFDLGTEGGTAITLSKSNVLEYIVDCETVCDERSMPDDGRFMVIPPWMSGLIQKSDLKDAALAGDGQSVMRNGRLGMIGKFTLYKSNQLAISHDGSAADCTNILFGTKDAITFASQLTENTNVDNPFGFGRLFKGLQVYGFEVVLPRCLGVLFAKK